MKLVVTTPMAVLAEAADVVAVRAEDPTGAFGILPGHADFLTVLVPSVLSWRERSGREGHVAVRGGVLTVSNGALVAVATREGFTGEDLDQLEQALTAGVAAAAEAARAARTETARLEVSAIRHLQAYLQAGQAQRMPREERR